MYISLDEIHKQVGKFPFKVESKHGNVFIVNGKTPKSAGRFTGDCVNDPKRSGDSLIGDFGWRLVDPMDGVTAQGVSQYVVKDTPQPVQKKCTCGGQKCNTTHSHWCDLTTMNRLSLCRKK